MEKLLSVSNIAIRLHRNRYQINVFKFKYEFPHLYKNVN